MTRVTLSLTANTARPETATVMTALPIAAFLYAVNQDVSYAAIGTYSVREFSAQKPCTAGRRGYIIARFVLTSHLLEGNRLESFTYPRDFSLSAYVEEERHFDFFPQGEIQVIPSPSQVASYVLNLEAKPHSVACFERKR
jgi:hypothetical protein